MTNSLERRTYRYGFACDAKNRRCATTERIGVLDTAVQSGSTSTLQNLANTWDQFGSSTERHDFQSSLDEGYQYTDLLNRLTVVDTLGNGAITGTEVSLGYDLLGDIISKSDVGTYTYPATGSAHPHGVASIANTGGGTTTLTYNGNGHVYAETGAISRGIVWNLIGKASSTTYSGLSLNFQYDADGNRIRQTETNNGHIIYLPDGELYLFSGSPPKQSWRSYFTIDGQRVAEAFGPAAAIKHYYLHADAQGSVTTVTDDGFNPASPTTDQNNGYDSFGQPRNANGSANPTWGQGAITTTSYINQERLTNEHLINLNARVYDPALGQLPSPDPIIADISDSQAWNPYAYANNNPMSQRDPTGLDATGGCTQVQCQSTSDPPTDSSGGDPYPNPGDPPVTGSTDGHGNSTTIGYPPPLTYPGGTTDIGYPGGFSIGGSGTSGGGGPGDGGGGGGGGGGGASGAGGGGGGGGGGGSGGSGGGPGSGPTGTPGGLSWARTPPPKGHSHVASEPRACAATSARILQGNSHLIGKPGGFSGNQAIPVTSGSAAIIPGEFGMIKSQLRPYLGQISGTVNGQPLFNGVTDILANHVSPVPGMATPQALEGLNPGSIILEVAGLSADMGTQSVVVSAPGAVNCPSAP